MKYTDKTSVENLLGRSLSAQEVVLLPSYIEAISLKITNYTNRQWSDIDTTESAEDETRLFDTNNSHSAFVDDFYDPTQINIVDCYGNKRELTSSDFYQLYPLNQDVKNEIRLCSYMFFRKNRPGIEITAKFAISLPETVKIAATQLVAFKIQNMAILSESKGLSSENIEGYSYKVISQNEVSAYEENILSTLDGLRKPLL